MGNSICIENEPTYLLRLDRHSSFGSNTSGAGGGGNGGYLSNRSSGSASAFAYNNNNNYYHSTDSSADRYGSGGSGMNSARSGASSVPNAAFDGFDHNIKIIGIESRDGRLQYRFPDVASCVSSVQDWRHQAADLSHMALVVIRVSRRPADNKDFVVSAADTVSLYSWASLAEEVFTPRGLAEPRSVDLPPGCQWRAANNASPSSFSPPLTLSLYLLRGKQAHPKAVVEALFTLNRIERSFIHDQVGLQELFYNRLSNSYPRSLNYMQGSWDAPMGQDAITKRNANHLLKAFLGKLGTGHLGKRSDSFQSNNNLTTPRLNSNHLDNLSFGQQQQHQRQLSSISNPNNANNNNSHSRTVSGSNLNVFSTGLNNNNNNNNNIRENVMRLSDLTTLKDKNNNNSNNITKPNTLNISQESGIGEIKRSRTGTYTKEVAEANAEIQREQQQDQEEQQSAVKTNDMAIPLIGRNTSTSTVMDNLSAAQRSSLALNITSAANNEDDSANDAYPVDDREMRLRRAAPQAAEVLPGLFVGGEMPSRNKSLLKSKNITHIINCAASMLENHFPKDFEYTALSLSDSADEQIQFLFPHVVEIIDRVLEIERGRVLVHCHQGVSRSCTFVIAYVMWKRGLPYNSAFKVVREKRDVCSPNAGFMCNLMRWEDMLANASRFALIEFGPYRKDMQWPYIWRVRLPDHASGTGMNYDDDSDEEDNKTKNEKSQQQEGKNKSLTEIEIDSRSVSALVSFEERATTAKLFKGANCNQVLARDAIERLQSWVLFGNFSNSGVSSSHYLLVEYLNVGMAAEESLDDEQQSNHHNDTGDLEIVDFGSTDDVEYRAIHEAGYYSLLLKSQETKEFTENLLSTEESYEESKEKYFQEQLRLAKLRGAVSSVMTSSNSARARQINQQHHQQQQRQQHQHSSPVNGNNQQQQKQSGSGSGSSSTTSFPLPNNNNSNSQQQLSQSQHQQQQLGGSASSKPSFSIAAGIQGFNNINNNPQSNADTVSSTTGGGISPDASQEIRSSNNNNNNASVGNLNSSVGHNSHQNNNHLSMSASNSPAVNAALAGGFVALRAPLWDPVGEHDLLDFDDFDPEEVYLFFIKPRHGKKTGNIYLWVGEDSGWSEQSCHESYQKLVESAMNHTNPDSVDVAVDPHEDDEQPHPHVLVGELLRHRAFENQQVTIIREREEPDDFVALF